MKSKKTGYWVRRNGPDGPQYLDPTGGWTNLTRKAATFSEADGMKALTKAGDGDLVPVPVDD